MFIAIVSPCVINEKFGAPLVLASIFLSCIFYYVPVFSSIPSGFVIIIASVIVSAVFAIVAPIPDEDEEEGEEAHKNKNNPHPCEEKGAEISAGGSVK